MKSFVKLACAIFALILLLRIIQNYRHASITEAGHLVADWATLIASGIALLLAYGIWRSAKT